MEQPVLKEDLFGHAKQYDDLPILNFPKALTIFSLYHHLIHQKLPQPQLPTSGVADLAGNIMENGVGFAVYGQNPVVVEVGQENIAEQNIVERYQLCSLNCAGKVLLHSSDSSWSLPWHPGSHSKQHRTGSVDL